MKLNIDRCTETLIPQHTHHTEHVLSELKIVQHKNCCYWIWIGDKDQICNAPTCFFYHFILFSQAKLLLTFSGKEKLNNLFCVSWERVTLVSSDTRVGR